MWGETLLKKKAVILILVLLVNDLIVATIMFHFIKVNYKNSINVPRSNNSISQSKYSKPKKIFLSSGTFSSKLLEFKKAVNDSNTENLVECAQYFESDVETSLLAFEVWREVTLMDPMNAEWWIRFSQQLWFYEYRLQAIHAVKIAIKLDKDNPTYYEMLAIYSSKYKPLIGSAYGYAKIAIKLAEQQLCDDKATKIKENLQSIVNLK